VWNRRHPLVTRSSRSAWDWATVAFAASLDPIPRRTALLSDSAKAACWIRLCISSNTYDIWGGLPERDPELLQSAFELVFGPARGASMSLVLWIEDIHEARLRVIDTQKWAAVREFDEIRQYLPEPPSAWKLVSRD
jgi:hypothetical protein